MKKWGVSAVWIMFAFCMIAPQVQAEFTINGFLLHQYGLFISGDNNNQAQDPDSNKPRYFPTDHGDIGGSPSIGRNVLQLEADWWPFEYVRMKGIFRGVYSMSLKADRYAQIPDLPADRFYNNDTSVKDKKRQLVRDRYYNEADIRELYLDIFASKRLSFRVGRQQVTWGSTGSFRLLDVVNPINAAWHFAPFESFEDVRVPLWIIKGLYDIPALNGSMEVLWVPAIEPDPNDLVNFPLTFVGAWGLPIAPLNEFDSSLTITKKELLLPDSDLTDSRIGVRWNGNAGGLNYTLVYYWTHAITPPIPTYVEQELALNEFGLHDTEVFLEFPRQTLFGFSLEYAFQSPTSLVIKLEASCEPDRRYPLNSFMGPGSSLDRTYNPNDWELMESREGWQRSKFPDVRRTAVNYALVLQRPNQWRWLNPTSSVITQFQIAQSFIFDKRSLNKDGDFLGRFALASPHVEQKSDNTGHTTRNENWWVVDIPGYDTTMTSPYSTTLVFALLTNYFHGRFSPLIIAAYLPQYMTDDQVAHDWTFFAAIGEAFKKGSGFTSVQLRFSWDNHWRLELGMNQLYGYDPYKGVGLFRDRDEVYAKVKYQF